jgi:hypothetical protein
VKPGDVVYIHADSREAFQYYSGQWSGVRLQNVFRGTSGVGCCSLTKNPINDAAYFESELKKFLESIRTRQVWLFLASPDHPFLMKPRNENAQLVHGLESKGCHQETTPRFHNVDVLRFTCPNP